MTQFVYLSNAISGTISRYKLEDGVLTLLGETEVGEMVMPLVVSHCQNFLYAALRSDSYRVDQFNIDQQTGDLIIQSSREVDESIVSLDIDSNNQWLIASSFDHNRVVVKALGESGEVTDSTSVIQHQSHCHTFRFSPDENWMVATEFGRDRLCVYAAPTQENNGFEEVCEYKFVTGSGPRHLVFSPCGEFLYVLTEMVGSICTFSFDKANGLLKFIAETPVLPSVKLEKGLPPAQRVANDIPRMWTADVHITANGRYLYVSERTLSVIACLEISRDDRLPRYSNHFSVEQQPRSFMITHDDQYLLVSGELAEELGLYRISSETGSLEKVSSAPCGEGANWVCGISIG